jgi:hypothetical protein
MRRLCVTIDSNDRKVTQVIDFVSTDDLRQLATAADQYSVSVYLPTHPTGNERAQDPIRLKNLLARARREMEALGLPPRQIDELLAPADAVHDQADFWTEMSNGLAVLIDTHGMRTYRLPTLVDELSVVADHFHLKPLLASLAADEVFYVLALSQNQVRLLRGNRFALNEVSLGEIPASLAEALRFDDRESQLQSHGSHRVGSGTVVATFHGQGAGKDMDKVDLDRFLTAVDHGVREIVGTTSAPLVLAGVDHVVGHFRKLSGSAQIVEGDVRGNQDRVSADDLHRRAWPLVQPLLEAAQNDALRAIATASKPTLSALPQIVVSSMDGRIESLVLPRGVQRWGTFNIEDRIAIEHETRRPGDRDLLDIAAIETLSHGGNVHLVPRDRLPAHLPVAATLRY